MKIEISKSDIQKIIAQGEHEYPYECCGFLLGKMNGKSKKVVQIFAVENARDTQNRHNRYLIPPKDYMAVEELAKKDGLEILGFYHSHPDAEARPSQYDIDHSWPWYSYIIVSIKQRQADGMTCWNLKEDRSGFNPEKVIVI
jgi:proteasome lid subunit RPN8/RPN11